MTTINHNRILILIAFAWLMPAAACSVHKHVPSRQAAFSVLGLGDSITEGGADFSSYLFPLDSLLKKAGYQPRFIGPRFSVQDNDTLHHAGFSGKTAEYLAKTIDSLYTAFPADIVLLHAGHNHFAEEAPIPGIIEAQKKIISTIRSKNSGAVILVAGVITSGKLPKYAYVPDLDLAISSMVDSIHQSSIIFVNQQNGWNWQQHSIQDKVHPNKTGARIIAANWLKAIPGALENKAKQ
ncbi:MAG: GDSL-type esterase/lipase family protein [Chitinophagaceae bacterium]